MSNQSDAGFRPSFNNSSRQDEIGKDRLKEIWVQLLLRWKKAFAIFLAFALIGIFLIVNRSELYSSEAVLLLKQQGQPGQLIGPQSRQTDLAAVNSEVEILRTAIFAQKVVRQLNLSEDPAFQYRPSAISRIAGILLPTKGVNKSREEKERYAARKLANRIRVSQKPDTYLVRIRFTDSNPKRTADIVNSFSDNFVGDAFGRQGQTTQQSIEWISDYVKTLQDRVQKSEEVLSKSVSIATTKGKIANTEVAASQKQVLDFLRTQSIKEQRRAKSLLDGKKEPENQLAPTPPLNAAAQNPEGSDIGAIKQEIALSKNVIEELMRRARLADIRSRPRARPQVEIISRAAVPIFPVGPNLKILLPMVLVLSAMASIGLTLIPAVRHSAFRSMGQASRAGFWVAGNIPTVDNTWASMFSRKTLNDYKQSVNDIHAICLSLGLDKTKGTGSIILVSSPRGGEGSAVTASLMATSLTQMGQDCLLIDGDLTNPTIHKLFEIEGETGLTNLLQDPSDVIDTAVHHGEGLPSILPTGNAGSGVLDIVTTKRLTAFFDELRSMYDTIIIDGGGVLNSPDPALFASHADLCLLAAKWDVTNWQDAAQSWNILSQRSDKSPRLVLTEVNRRRMFTFEEAYHEGTVAISDGSAHDWDVSSSSAVENPRVPAQDNLELIHGHSQAREIERAGNSDDNLTSEQLRESFREHIRKRR